MTLLSASLLCFFQLRYSEMSLGQSVISDWKIFTGFAPGVGIAQPPSNIELGRPFLGPPIGVAHHFRQNLIGILAWRQQRYAGCQPDALEQLGRIERRNERVFLAVPHDRHALDTHALELVEPA